MEGRQWITRTLRPASLLSTIIATAVKRRSGSFPLVLITHVQRTAIDGNGGTRTRTCYRTQPFKGNHHLTSQDGQVAGDGHFARLPIPPRSRSACSRGRTGDLLLFKQMLLPAELSKRVSYSRKRKDSNPQDAWRRNRFRGGPLILPDRFRVVGEKGIEPLRSRSQSECPATRRLP